MGIRRRCVGEREIESRRDVIGTGRRGGGGLAPRDAPSRPEHPGPRTRRAHASHDALAREVLVVRGRLLVHGGVASR